MAGAHAFTSAAMSHSAPPPAPLVRFVISSVVIALLAACGGGGDAGDEDMTAMSAPSAGGSVAYALATAPARNTPPPTASIQTLPQPRASTALTSLASVRPASTSAVQSIDPADIIAELNSARPTDEQTWYGVNCFGRYGSMKTMPNGEVHGTPLADGSTLRMGKVDDPLMPGHPTFMVRVGMEDVLTAAGKRCELIAYGDELTALPIGQDIWYGVSVLVSEGFESRGDVQSILQWHTKGFNPFFAMLLRNGKLHAQVRYNTLADGKPANSVLETVWQDHLPVERKWMTFVVHARISTADKAEPFIKVWRDGNLIIDRQGPIGYSTAEFHYARIGFYHWVNSGNTWDRNVPVRSLMFKKSFTARDAAGRYNEEVIRSYVEAE